MRITIREVQSDAELPCPRSNSIAHSTNCRTRSLLNLVQRFLHVEVASGAILLICSVLALVAANSAFAEQFLGIWAEKVLLYERITREAISPLEYLIHVVHPWVAFVIMPIFALANAGVPFQLADVGSPVAVAVILGLLVGKPVGILLFSWISVKLGLVQLPGGVNWRHMTGGGFLAGIGFTMALFIAGLAFGDEALLRSAKVGVLVGSLASAVAGMAILSISAAPGKERSPE